MPEIVEIEEFLALSQTIPVVDVRSPVEFELGSIPGATNIPVFSNEERAEIGTLYKQKGPDAATQRGLELVAPNLLKLAESALKTAQNHTKPSHLGGNQVLVHCWRGGMRSQSMAELFETAGIETRILKGGYKAFRHYVRESFARKIDLKIVGGETGSGKTEILRHLKNAGEQVIDLEAIASHRGSSFGAIGMNEQPGVENFENNLFDALSKIDPKRRVWMEDESRSIGRVFIPEPLWIQMKAAPIYRVQIPFEVRVQRLITDYGDFPKEILREALDRIKKRLGGLDYKNSLEALEKGDLATATRAALRYYDKAYDWPHQQREYANVTIIQCEDGDPEKNAKNILNMID